MFCLAYPKKNDLCAMKKCQWQNPQTNNIHRAFTLQKYWKLSKTHILVSLLNTEQAHFTIHVLGIGWEEWVNIFLLGLEKRVGKYALQLGISHI